MNIISRKIILIGLLCVCGFLPSVAFAANTGDKAPDFVAQSMDGVEVKLSQFVGKPVVLEWFNTGCPFVKKHYRSGDMQGLQKEFTEKGVIWLTISSTRKGHKDHLDADKARDFFVGNKMASTYLLNDESGTIGKLYGAKTTPHMFVIDAKGVLVYQGAIDDNPEVFAEPSQSKNYVRSALDELLAGGEVATGETKPYGCSIKYAD